MQEFTLVEFFQVEDELNVDSCIQEARKLCVEEIKAFEFTQGDEELREIAACVDKHLDRIELACATTMPTRREEGYHGCGHFFRRRKSLAFLFWFTCALFLFWRRRPCRTVEQQVDEEEEELAPYLLKEEKA